MRKTALTVILLLAFAPAFAQSAAEIAAAKSVARSYGYSESEINDVLNKEASANASYSRPELQNRTDSKLNMTKEVDGPVDYMGENSVELKPVDASVVEKSDIYGHNFFISKGLSLIPNISAPVPESYVIGSGDVLSLTMWGAANEDVTLSVAGDGTVNIPHAGPVFISGQTLSSAERTLKSKLSKYYQGLDDGSTNLKISVSRIRGVAVYVLGEVSVPGVYTLPSLCNIPSAIYMAGGIKKNGSVRKINLFRGGKKLGCFDLYAFIFNGDSGTALKLQDGDIISAEASSNLVSLSGEVNRAKKFELVDNESIADLIKYAGGFTPDARRDMVHVDRVAAEGGVTFDVPSSLFDSFKLRNGDNVFVGSCDTLFKNKVVLTGNVQHEGPYSISDNMHTVSQLIAAAGGLKEGTFMKRAHIDRLDSDRLPVTVSFSLEDIISGKSDIELVRDDEITVYSNESLRDTTVVVEIMGEVNSPGSYSFRDGMTLGDLVMIAGGTKDGADLSKVEIAVRGRDGEASITSVNILGGGDGMSIVLNAYDKVFVRAKENYRDLKTIQVVGEVKYPGFYAVEKNSVRLSDIISRASGFTSDAYVKGARLKRVYQDNEVDMAEMVMKVAGANRFVRDTSSLDSLKNNIKSGDTYSVAIDLESAIKNPYSEVDIILRDGDIIEVPQMNNTVKISGGVYLPNVVAYHPKYKWRDYVNLAGGFAKGARRSKLYVVYQDGSSAVRGSAKFHSEPGMEIVVPQVDKSAQRKLSGGEWATIASVATSMVSVVVMVINQLAR